MKIFAELDDAVLNRPVQASNDSIAVATAMAAPLRPESRPLRVIGRGDTLTAQKVEVGIILQAMLGTGGAAEYLSDNAVHISVSLRVLTKPALRRGMHDEFGIPTTLDN
ncbi:hypothetical protein F2P44_15115 [Massilia sp. CCM 8695]|uniref:Uncharacterized protein n=1 Tax=Massilia frigida TaxID=2609281 RepID=A0ABX0N893_9BURK|nr:hypothetical protein [Massilia frigida]NHZ80593.1 hypothetical protein [Massilia frigida]